jgi:Uma2 family endonuclease
MPSALQAPPITVEQFEAFEGYPGLKDELINGEIVLSPQPKPLHQQVAKNICRLLDEALRGQDYTAQQNSNIQFREANSMPAPDVFVITKKAWKLACERDEYLSAPPVLVVEVISPANRKKRVEAKTEVYLSGGVSEVWLVHPKTRALDVVRRGNRGNKEVSPLRFPAGPNAGVKLELPNPLSGFVWCEAFFDIA